MEDSTFVEERKPSVNKYRVIAKRGGIVHDGESILEADPAFETFKFQIGRDGHRISRIRHHETVVSLL